MKESSEVYRERLARIFTATVEFYKTRYSPDFSRFMVESLSGANLKIFREGTDDEIRDKLAYLLEQCGHRVLESMEDNFRVAITGVRREHD